ncbi:TetR/AcrR family transcriptional regulator [Mangrovibacter yixingensis]|uniref:TetR/AcrR family transcriptional regulator n=1 Tax=Mangrovibacter yixingensis TaxID=1529639 RepID=UPI001CFB81C1|nr:TetR/AcrR family transcriptional regulator [Mangrovibacter yixingensis]
MTVSETTNRRLLILQCAYEAFIELGFAKTTTAIIAARAKISKRTIYEAFADKNALFAAVLQEHSHRILDLPRPPGENIPLAQTLFGIFRLDINEAEARGRDAILNLLVREAVLFPALSEYLYEHEIIRSREALMAWLEEEHARGRIVANEPEFYAGMMMDVVFGALLPRRRIHGSANRAKAHAEIKRRLLIVLNSMQQPIDNGTGINPDF